MAGPNKPVDVIVLAAGKGTRMRSDLPKVLHTVGGKPLLSHVLETAHALAADHVHVVYGHGGEQVPDTIADEKVTWVLQDEQHGTGHAVMQAMPGVGDEAIALVLYGDVPLVQASTLKGLISAAAENALALLTMQLAQPGAYGRIVRDQDGNITSIVEKKDATEEQLAIGEINTGFLAAPAAKLRQWLAELSNDNAQGEYYLTDIVAMAVDEGYSVVSQNPAKVTEIEGINSKIELAKMERNYQSQQAEALMEQGLTLRDPSRFDLRGELRIGKDVVVDINVIIEGNVSLGDNVNIGPNVVLRDVSIGDGTEVLANCVLEQAEVGKECRIGPFARLRPGARLADSVHVGNFVEIKNSQVAAGSKINHLAYVGDSKIGSKVNVGAGAITANYDGANKHETIIEDGVSIGANSVLVAPVKVGENATLGAGTILRKEAPANELTMSAGKQRSIKGWKRPVKKK